MGGKKTKRKRWIMVDYYMHNYNAGQRRVTQNPFNDGRHARLSPGPRQLNYCETQVCMNEKVMRGTVQGQLQVK